MAARSMGGGGAWRGWWPGAGTGRRCGALAALVAGLGLGLAACQPRPSGPLVPSAIENTPLALVAGTAGLPTALPTATSPVAPTRLPPPPEPLTVAPGFELGVFAEGLGPVRMLARAPNGDLFATVPRDDKVLVLPDRDRDGVADAVHVFAAGEGLHEPYGLLAEDGWVTVANVDGVVRLPYRVGDLQAAGPPELLLPLPAEGEVRERALARGADGALYVSVGASCNACVETDPRRATVLRVLPDRPVQAYGLGLRAVAGLAPAPRSGALWAGDRGRDGLGDTRPPDELNLLSPGANYGWPFCYGDRVPDPSQGATAEVCAGTAPPALALPAHVGVGGLAFAEGESLPPAWRDDLFVALRGAMDTGFPAGHKVVRVGFAGGLPTGEVVDLVSGWLRPDTRRWGSPSDLAFAADGALLVADDGGERVYRLIYAPAPLTPTPIF